MENKVINIKIVAQVARALKELKDQMVFIGGVFKNIESANESEDS